MAKSYKLEDGNYIDSGSIVHSKTKLKDILTYSTTEQKVGTWIDGKPIYRKVYKGTRNSDESFILPTNISDWKELITLRGILRVPTKNLYISIPGVSFSNTTLQGIQLQIIDKSSAWQPNSFYVVASSGIKITDYVIIFEYTKATD